MAGSLQRVFAPSGPFPSQSAWEKEVRFVLDHLVSSTLAQPAESSNTHPPHPPPPTHTQLGCQWSLKLLRSQAMLLTTAVHAVMQPGLTQMNLFVKVNASDRAAYEAFIAAQLGLPVEAVGIKSLGPPNSPE